MVAATHPWPVFKSLAGYRANWLGRDIGAGLAVAAVGLPSAIAYPAIVGLPPETGIYASIAAPIAYALLGPSQRLVLGPDAATMTVLGAAIASIIASMPADAGVDRVTIASALGLAVGGVCLAARLLRLGVVATFLSRPILVGFFAGIAISIVVGQIGRLTGVKIRSEGLVAPVLELIGKSAEIHWPSLLLGASMFVLLQAANRLRLPIPGPVLVVVLAVVLSALLGFREMGVKVVGDIPLGLPSFSIPSFRGLPLDKMLLGAAAVFLVSFGAGIITARSFAARSGEAVDANGELIGLSAGNIAAGLFGAFPISMSDSRTAIAFAAGGRSQIVGLVSAATLIATLLFLGEALRILPLPALGAILVSAAIGLIDIGELKRIWQISRPEFVFAMITMWGAISFGVLNGVVIAIAATLVYLLRKSMYPRDAQLGRIPGRDGLYKLHRSPEAAPIQGLVLYVIQGSLLFVNADYVGERIKTTVRKLASGCRWFVIDASAIVQVDSTAAAMLDEVREDLAAKDIRLCLAEVHTEVREILERSGVIERIGTQYVFDDLEDAVAAFQTEAERPRAQEGLLSSALPMHVSEVKR
ncbi:STAS domain-containing protein [Phyllobacterium sp. SYP-B3895]|uniref:SulP family inorganic anion transporter n=1 Tax=Phyllobacterium sp. SYP-B3895 TaxID=2663240 RepID=UPI001299729F|nr:SulP family inorganic anion transporter [Phyllobacterium sp. SYP-B3895]MRG57952.1 STAS domain-containing protein [Phyllobacterium sp. SYP-B3895]